MLASFLPIVYDRVSCSQGWSHYLVKDKLELLILVPLLPECSDTCVHHNTWFYVAPGIKSRALCKLGKYSTGVV